MDKEGYWVTFAESWIEFLNQANEGLPYKTGSTVIIKFSMGYSGTCLTRSPSLKEIPDLRIQSNFMKNVTLQTHVGILLLKYNFAAAFVICN